MEAWAVRLGANDAIKGPSVTRYEYATAPLISHALQAILNQWGDDGWELVAVQDNVAYFKREKA